jgi:U2 small nuclear ribonucleoprotein A'
MGIQSQTFDHNESAGGGTKDYTVRLVEAEKNTIEEKIRAAKSLDEIARLERELRVGYTRDMEDLF